MGLFLEIIVKKVAQCQCLDAHVEEPYEMPMTWEPDDRSNFFFSPNDICVPSHVCIKLNIGDV